MFLILFNISFNSILSHYVPKLLIYNQFTFSIMQRFFILILVSKLLASCNSVTNKTEQPSIQEIKSPAGTNSKLPYLVKGDDEHLYMSWVEIVDHDSVLLKYSKMTNQEWSTPETIASGTDWFVNWADYPMIAIDSNGNMLAHYLQKSAIGTYTYDVKVSRKKRKERWSESSKPHTDSTQSEHGFVSLLPWTNGKFLISWLDGRYTVSDTSAIDHDDHAQKGAMTVRSAIIDMNGQLTDEFELDHRVCDCCQTSATMTPNGPIVVYRDRSEDEVRDMSIVRLLDGEWTAPQIINHDNWEIAGCPVNGPRVTSMGDYVAVTWFTAAQDSAQVKLAFSNDGGATFGQPIIVDNTYPQGRVDVVSTDYHTVAVSWLDEDSGEAIIKTAQYNEHGRIGDEIHITATSPARQSGFPQMEYYNGKLYYAWADLNSGKIAMSEMSILTSK